MLKALVSRLLCPTCLNGERSLMAQVFNEGAAGHIRDGVLVCDGCRAWYPIEDDLLDLVKASLLDPKGLARFCDRFARELQALQLPLPAEHAHADSNGVDAQMKQREHFDWWADNTQQDYSAYQQTPFWLAADEVTYKDWIARVQPADWLLDLGCADGRSAFRFVGKCNVVGFDISRRMVRKAIERARAAGAEATTTFLVADADNLPFRSQSFDYAVTYGVLHHFPNPERSCQVIQRILRDGGVHLGSENNKSAFRAIFDLMMKLRPLWVEEAGKEPLISRRMIHDWTRDLPVKIQCWTSVFLPPHLFNLVGKRAAGPLLSMTDRVFSWMPWFSRQGGLLVFEIAKKGSPRTTAPIARQPV